MSTPQGLAGLRRLRLRRFRLSAAKAPVRSLEKAQAKVQYHEYPKIEHIVIVQAAIKEVFAFFEAAGSAK